eukprot:3439231-Amphidinium_carterae.1
MYIEAVQNLSFCMAARCLRSSPHTVPFEKAFPLLPIKVPPWPVPRPKARILRVSLRRSHRHDVCSPVCSNSIDVVFQPSVPVHTYEVASSSMQAVTHTVCRPRLELSAMINGQR